MPRSSSEFITLCNDDYPDQREFVFSMKSRPFSMLSSQKLPVPTTSLIDFNLVSELGLKMSDLQCSKFSYGGHKFRILGRISQTVQTITDGVISGTVHMRASVVEGLRSVFDSHGIAGKKFSELLTRKVSHTTPPASPKPSTPGSTRSSSRGSNSSTTSTPLFTKSPKGPATPKMSSPDWHAEILSKLRAKDKYQAPRSSPKPHNSHWSTTYSQPQRKLPAGCHRTLSLKPDDKHYYGRVTWLSTPDEVDGSAYVMMDYINHKSRRLMTMTSTQPHFLVRDLKPGDPVLFRRYDTQEEADQDDQMDKCPILMIYAPAEEAQLQSLGVVFPELPPELHSSGYYG